MSSQGLHIISQLVDVGFVLLVIATAFRVFGSKRDGAESNVEKWRSELSGLESSLRELLDEAGAASRNFDRTLIARRNELQTLVSRATDCCLELDKRLMTATSDVPYNESAEFPNESWIPSPRAERPIPAHNARNAQSYAPKNAQGTTPRNSEIPRATRPVPQSRQLQEESASLRDQIAVEQSTEQNEPVAYRVARRLLLQGKPVPLVARKLEIPVSDVRRLAASIEQREMSDPGTQPERSVASPFQGQQDFRADEPLKRGIIGS